MEQSVVPLVAAASRGVLGVGHLSTEESHSGKCSKGPEYAGWRRRSLPDEPITCQPVSVRARGHVDKSIGGSSGAGNGGGGSSGSSGSSSNSNRYGPSALLVRLLQEVHEEFRAYLFLFEEVVRLLLVRL